MFNRVWFWAEQGQVGRTTSSERMEARRNEMGRGPYDSYGLLGLCTSPTQAHTFELYTSVLVFGGQEKPVPTWPTGVTAPHELVIAQPIDAGTILHERASQPHGRTR